MRVGTPHANSAKEWSGQSGTRVFGREQDHGRFQAVRSRLLTLVALAAIIVTLAFDAQLSPALAQCTGPASATVCTSGGNFYTSGINVDTNNGLGGTPIGLTLQPGVSVIIPAGSSVLDSVNTANTTGTTSGSADITINADGVTINNAASSASPSGTERTGLRIQSSGNATITATNTSITLGPTPSASTNGIWAIAMPNAPQTAHTASVLWIGGSISAFGQNSTGIQAENRGAGDARIDASGNITGSVGSAGGFTFLGLDATAADSTSATVLGGLRDITGVPAAGVVGNASIIYRSGTINVLGNFSAGIFASADAGSATITTLGGTSITVGQQFSTDTLQPGIDAFSDSGTATVTSASSILINGSPAVPATNYKSNPTGIRATSNLGTAASVTYTGPGITVHGGAGLGIVAVTGNGSATVSASGGPITADGSNAVGILADSGTVRNTAQGRPVTTTTGPLLVSANNISTLGNFGTGISATGGSGGVTVNIASGGSIMGGWQADIASAGTAYGLKATGVVLGSSAGTATLNNAGSIGALSDRAVANTPLFASNNTSIINNGTITGFAQLAGSGNSILNNTTFNLRHFADTNGDGVRDTLRVAVTDLGPGTFTNIGTLALLGGPGATVLDATGQYLPLGLTFNAMSLGGPVQGQILGATTFTNAGTIDLQANPVPGDVLLITGGHTPGTTGGGTFIASGGRLLLDTVLNQGGPASSSDVLVVDGTAVGPGGATQMLVRNFGGAGAITVNNGILVVQSVDPTRSVGGVFALGAPAVAGPFEYLLFHGGVGADAADGNWYLRSTINCGTPGAPMPPCPPTPVPGPNPGPVIPDFRPETSLYAAIPSMALVYGRNLLDTLHERVGEEEDQRGAAPNPNGWARLIGMHGHREGDLLGIFGSGPTYNYDFGGLQAGRDLYRRDNADGSRDHAGVYFAIGDALGKVTHILTGLTGDSDFTGYSFAGYWTHFGAPGWYLDGILQGTLYDINSNAHRGLQPLQTLGKGFAGSLEAGYPFRFYNGFFIEPQVQAIGQHIDIDTTRDAGGPIKFDDVNSLLTRIGARFGYTWTLGGGAAPRTVTAWIRPNIWHEFLGNPLTEFGSATGFIPFRADQRGTWGELNAGISGQLNPSTTLYANAAYQERFDNTKTFAYTGKIGARVSW
jgi:autotransporter family porin